MTPVVIDTNVWLDWLVFVDPATAALDAAAAAGRVRVLASRRMREECAGVLRQPALQRRGAPADALLARFDALAALIGDPARCALTCRDRNDQVFLDLAVGARARWLLTRDKALLRLARRAWRDHGLGIVTPASCTAL